MLKIALCDDNGKDINRYAGFTKRIAGEYQIQIDLSCFYKGKFLFRRYRNNLEELDSVYLNLFMGTMDGMETARKLLACSCRAQILFLTSCEDYVFEAFVVYISDHSIYGEKAI